MPPVPEDSPGALVGGMSSGDLAGCALFLVGLPDKQSTTIAEARQDTFWRRGRWSTAKAFSGSLFNLEPELPRIRMPSRNSWKAPLSSSSRFGRSSLGLGLISATCPACRATESLRDVETACNKHQADARFAKKNPAVCMAIEPHLPDDPRTAATLDNHNVPARFERERITNLPGTPQQT